MGKSLSMEKIEVHLERGEMEVGEEERQYRGR